MKKVTGYERSEIEEVSNEKENFPKPSEWKEFFKQIAEGKIEAVDCLYGRVSGRLYGFILWHLGNPEDACDAVQEVFVRLVSNRRKLRKVVNPGAWLFTIAYRVSVDILRRRKRQNITPLETAVPLVLPDSDAGDYQQLDLLSDALRTLKPVQRDAIYLKTFFDYTFSEIGGILGIPTFTAASRYRNGMKKLRHIMEANYE